MYVASVGPLFHAVTTLSLPVGLRWGLLRRVRYGAVGGTGGVCMYVASVAILGCVYVCRSIFQYDFWPVYVCRLGRVTFRTYVHICLKWHRCMYVASVGPLFAVHFSYVRTPH